APAGYWALRATRAAPARNGGVRAARDGRDGRGEPDGRVPPVGTPIAPDTALPSSTAAPAACDAFLASAAAAAARNDLGAAERELDGAAGACADASLVARERAGLRFRQGRYEEAAAWAQQRVVADPADAYAWELLGAIRFVRGEREAALVA